MINPAPNNLQGRDCLKTLTRQLGWGVKVSGFKVKVVLTLSVQLRYTVLETEANTMLHCPEKKFPP